MRPLALAILLLGACAAGAESHDATIRRRVSINGSAPSHEEVEYFTQGKMATEGPRNRMVVDLARQTLTTIDTEAKTFTVLSATQLRERAAAFARRLSPDEREQMGVDTNVTVKPTGRTERIAGCDTHEIALTGARVHAVIWVTDALALPASPAAWQALLGPAGNHPMGLVAKAIHTQDPAAVVLRESFTITFGGREVVATREATEVNDHAIPAEVFTVPAGYTEAPPPY